MSKTITLQVGEEYNVLDRANKAYITKIHPESDWPYKGYLQHSIAGSIYMEWNHLGQSDVHFMHNICDPIIWDKISLAEMRQLTQELYKNLKSQQSENIYRSDQVKDLEGQINRFEKLEKDIENSLKKWPYRLANWIDENFLK